MQINRRRNSILDNTQTQRVQEKAHLDDGGEKKW